MTLSVSYFEKQCLVLNKSLVDVHETAWLLISPKKRNTAEEGKVAGLPLEVPWITTATNKRENVHPHCHSRYVILTPGIVNHLKA